MDKDIFDLLVTLEDRISVLEIMVLDKGFGCPKKQGSKISESKRIIERIKQKMIEENSIPDIYKR